MKEAPTHRHALATPCTMSRAQLEKFARFLETHPGFYPELAGENAVICGFRVGECFLSIGEMSEFICAQPRLAANEAELLRAATTSSNSSVL